MPSLGSIIIVFATIIQITRASSIIPSHSELINSKDPEFFGAPAKNPSSSIKRKRFSLRNILSKRADEKLGQMCGKNFYGNDRVKKQVENFCERTKKYTDNPQRGPPKLPVYVGKDKLFEKEGALYQIPVKKFMGLRIMWYLLRKAGKNIDRDYFMVRIGDCSYVSTVRITKSGNLEKCAIDQTKPSRPGRKFFFRKDTKVNPVANQETST